MAETEEEEKPKHRNIFIIIQQYVIPVLIVLIVGFGSFWWAKSTVQKVKQEFTQQIDEMKNGMKALGKEKEQLDGELTKLKTAHEELRRKTCRGIWKEGNCLNRKCTDSDGDKGSESVWIEGKVNYTDENGYEKEEYDSCSGNKMQVLEGTCVEEPPGSGNFLFEKKPNPCPTNKCLGGVCIHKKKGKRASFELDLE